MIKRYFSKVLFYGSDDFSINPLKTLIKIKERGIIIKDLMVLTTESKESYSPNNNIVKNFCFENKIKYLNIFHYDKTIRKNKFDLVKNELVENYDLGIVCSFKYLVPSFMIENTKKGIYVIHPSLLPKYRGASPINYALLNGDKITGSSIIDCSMKNFDLGNIYIQKKLEIKNEYKFPELKEKLNELSCSILEDFLINFNEYKKLGKKQNNENSSYAPQLKKNDNLIDKNNKIDDVINKYKAFYQSTLKFIFCKIGNKILILEKINKENIIYDEKIDKKLFELLEIGSFFIHKNKKFLILKLNDGFLTIKDAYISCTKRVNFIQYHKFLVNKEYCKEILKSNLNIIENNKIFKIE